MSNLRVHGFSISIDGYGAGPAQTQDDPLGRGGLALHEWIFGTRTFQDMYGDGAGEGGVDDEFVARGFEGIGAWILGRNMFGPVRGPWPDDSWKGWWGDDPPYHAPVFVLTHHARAPLEMEGGTTFYFITTGIRDALARAKESAGGKDVRLGGGVSTIRQYLRERLVDELHIAITPVLLGSGEHLMGGIDLPSLGYACAEYVPSKKATHVVLRRQR
ncbi:MAG TPA: dihydrofolate reductase family protein [Gemmatimonadaceae bacterium]|nr:dihydrofolate reductase family protein [Gemmatimonadaceae bacterium]